MEDVTILAITRENDESLKTTFEIMIEGEIINRNTLIEILYATINEIRISTPIKN